MGDLGVRLFSLVFDSLALEFFLEFFVVFCSDAESFLRFLDAREELVILLVPFRRLLVGEGFDLDCFIVAFDQLFTFRLFDFFDDYSVEVGILDFEGVGEVGLLVSAVVEVVGLEQELLALEDELAVQALEVGDGLLGLEDGFVGLLELVGEEGVLGEQGGDLVDGGLEEGLQGGGWGLGRGFEGACDEVVYFLQV